VTVASPRSGHGLGGASREQEGSAAEERGPLISPKSPPPQLNSLLGELTDITIDGWIMTCKNVLLYLIDSGASLMIHWPLFSAGKSAC
jgi:hypothetical protein